MRLSLHPKRQTTADASVPMTAAEGWDTVVFLPGTWEGSFARHLLRAFARRMRGRGKVVCVERPWWPGAVLRRQTGPIAPANPETPRIRHLEENLLVIRPWVLLHNLVAEHVPGFPRINRHLLRWQLRQISPLGQLKVAWVFHPFQLEDADLCPEAFLMYGCYDRYDEPPVPQKESWKTRLRAREKALLAKADLVLTSSHPLQQLKLSQGVTSHWVPNAVDWEVFEKAGNDLAAVPDDLAKIPSPRLGFVGEMSERIDFELLDHLAQWRSRDSIVLVGGFSGVLEPKKAAIVRRLQSRRNVFFLGPRPYEQLPNYLKGFDVCLIPYENSEFNRCSSPLKLYEYLASGKPIVAVATPEIEAFADVVSVVPERDAFPRAVEQALQKAGDRKCAEERLKRARQNTWDQRVATIIDLIQSGSIR